MVPYLVGDREVPPKPDNHRTLQPTWRVASLNLFNLDKPGVIALGCVLALTRAARHTICLRRMVAATSTLGRA